VSASTDSSSEGFSGFFSDLDSLEVSLSFDFFEVSFAADFGAFFFGGSSVAGAWSSASSVYTCISSSADSSSSAAGAGFTSFFDFECFLATSFEEGAFFFSF